MQYRLCACVRVLQRHVICAFLCVMCLMHMCVLKNYKLTYIGIQMRIGRNQRAAVTSWPNLIFLCWASTFCVMLCCVLCLILCCVVLCSVSCTVLCSVWCCAVLWTEICCFLSYLPIVLHALYFMPTFVWKWHFNMANTPFISCNNFLKLCVTIKLLEHVFDSKCCGNCELCLWADSVDIFHCSFVVHLKMKCLCDRVLWEL